MVKLFGREWGTPIKEAESPLDILKVDRGKSMLGGTPKTELKEYRAEVEVNAKGYTVYKPRNIMDYYDKYFDRDLVRAPIDDLAESAFGMGCYTTSQEYEPLQEGRKSSTAKAKELVDEFNKYFNLDEWLVNIGKNLLIAGFLPVETRFTAGPIDKNTLKIIHPTTVKEVWVDKYGDIYKVVQKNGASGVDIDGKNISWFSYGMVGNDPFGISYVRGLMAILDTLDRATDNVDMILERYLSPTIIWKIMKGRDFEGFKAATTGKEPGEDIFLGDLSLEELEKGKLYDILSIDPRVPFWEYIVFLRERIYSYTRSNDIWFSKDATVASAETIDKIVKRHQHALQRSVKRGVERSWYEPLIKLNGAGAEAPRLNFGVEKTGVEDIRIEPILMKALELRFIDQDQFNDLVMQLGLKLKAPTGKFPEPAPTPVVTVDPSEPPENPKQTVKETPKPDASKEEVDGNTWLVRRLTDDAAHKHG